MHFNLFIWTFDSMCISSLCVKDLHLLLLMSILYLHDHKDKATQALKKIIKEIKMKKKII